MAVVSECSGRFGIVGIRERIVDNYGNSFHDYLLQIASFRKSVISLVFDINDDPSTLYLQFRCINPLDISIRIDQVVVRHLVLPKLFIGD